MTNIYIYIYIYIYIFYILYLLYSLAADAADPVWEGCVDVRGKVGTVFAAFGMLARRLVLTGF